MNKLKHIFLILRKNILSQLALFSTVMIFSAIISNYWEGARYPMVISALILAGYALVFSVAAIINGIKDVFKRNR